MKTCPRCQKVVDEEDNFCRQCGWNFHFKGKQSTPSSKPNKRCYEVVKYKDITIESLKAWLQQNNRIEIKDIQMSLRFYTKGILFTHAQWYVSHISIQYYPDSPKFHSYDLACDARTAGFRDVNKLLNKSINAQMPAGSTILLNRVQDAYQEGGTRTCCQCVIYEEKVD